MRNVVARAQGFGASRRRRLASAGATLILALALLQSVEAVPQAATAKPPRTLQDTGLYSDFPTLQVDPEHLAFSPQYPLWTDGATKRRWISLPPGTAIDGSDPDAWSFPAGTRLWKEFSFGGQRVETRYLEGSLKNVGLFLRHVSGAGAAPAVATTIGHPVKKPAPGQSPDAVLRIEPGRPDRSGLMQRMASRYPALQMPPLGTELVDEEAVALIRRWIAEADELRKEAHLQEKGR